jgi:DNA-binding NarL/FixJ family response regulator
MFKRETPICSHLFGQCEANKNMGQACSVSQKQPRTKFKNSSKTGVGNIGSFETIRDVCDFTGDPVVSYDKNMTIKSHNQKFVTLMNDETSDYVGMSITDFLQPEHAEIHDSNVSGKISKDIPPLGSGKSFIINRKKEKIFVRFSVRIWGKGYVTVIQDLRPFVVAREAACLRTQQQARQMVDHIIKNGVYGAEGVVRCLANEESIPLEHRHTLGIVAKRLGDTSLLCKDFEQETATLSPDYEVCPVKCDLKKSVLNYLEGYTHNDVLVVSSCFPKQIMLDWKLLRIALDNIMTNVRQHDSNFSTFMCRISGAQSIISFGLSIKIEFSNRIINVPPTNESHQGLGIPTIKRVLEKLGGSLECGSSENGIFTSELVFDCGKKGAPSVSEEQLCSNSNFIHDLCLGDVPSVSKTEPPARKPRMLYADDDILFRKLAKIVISECDGSSNSVITGESPQQVSRISSDILNADPPIDIVILDQHLGPGKTGSEVLGTNIVKELREQDYDGIVCVRSANDSNENRESYMKSGADQVLAKDQTPSQIKDIVCALWNKKCLTRDTMKSHKGTRVIDENRKGKCFVFL